MVDKLRVITDYLLKAESVVILPHINADGDALGASIALALALKKMNKEVNVLTEEEIPNNLNFLPGQDLVNQKGPEVYDVAVNIDNGDITRLGSREHYCHSARIRLSIDHHSTNKVEADCSYVDTTSSATGEIIYDLLTRYMNAELNKDIALCIYTAIVTDTGCFRYTNTTSRTLSVSSKLLEYEIDFPFVIKKAFDTMSLAKLSAIRQVINSLRLYEDGKIAVSYLTKKDIEIYSLKPDDFEGLVNIGRNIEGVEVSVFLREDGQDLFRVNLRSNDYVDVSKIAEGFNGGGHKRAAGLNISKKLEEAISALVDATISEIRGND